MKRFLIILISFLNILYSDVFYINTSYYDLTYDGKCEGENASDAQYECYFTLCGFVDDKFYHCTSSVVFENGDTGYTGISYTYHTISSYTGFAPLIQQLSEIEDYVFFGLDGLTFKYNSDTDSYFLPNGLDFKYDSSISSFPFHVDDSGVLFDLVNSTSMFNSDLGLYVDISDGKVSADLDGDGTFDSTSYIYDFDTGSLYDTSTGSKLTYNPDTNTYETTNNTSVCLNDPGCDPNTEIVVNCECACKYGMLNNECLPAPSSLDCSSQVVTNPNPNDWVEYPLYNTQDSCINFLSFNNLDGTFIIFTPDSSVCPVTSMCYGEPLEYQPPEDNTTTVPINTVDSSSILNFFNQSLQNQNDIKTKTDTTNNNLSDIKNKLDTFNSNLDDIKNKLDTTNTNLSNIDSALDSLNSKSDTTNNNLSDINSKIDTTNTNLSNIDNALSELSSKSDTTNNNLNNISSAISDASFSLGAKLGISNSNLEDIKSKLDTSSRNLSDMNSSLSNLFTGSFFDGDLSFDRFTEFYDNLQTDLDTVQNSFDETKSIIENGFEAPDVSRGSSPIFEANVLGSTLSIDLCSTFSVYRPFFYFIFSALFLWVAVKIFWAGFKVGSND